MKGVVNDEARSDGELLGLAVERPEAFGVFYRRHVRALLTYLLRRTRRPEVAADLCAETFALALERCERFDERRGPARGWLFVMAGSVLVDAARRGRVETRARERLGMPVRSLTDEDYERVEELIDATRRFDMAVLVADLPVEQREAVLARIVDEREYPDIAASLDVSEAVVRKRVSRGLTSLRSSLAKEGEA